MARTGIPMQITPVDQDNNLFEIVDLVPQSLVDQITQTPWMSLQYKLEEGNRNLRRRVLNNQLSWINEWHNCVAQVWDIIKKETGSNYLNYSDTGFWIDMPTYTCPIHTDGELPGAIQMYWVGSNLDIGTTWYQYRDHPDKIRHAFKFVPNTGYIMINTPEANGYRKLQWHGMLNPVPDNSFRVSSYSWLTHK
jgi:hypothetical protein